jgi:hypothetical protein
MLNKTQLKTNVLVFVGIIYIFLSNKFTIEHQCILDTKTENESDSDEEKFSFKDHKIFNLDGYNPHSFYNSELFEVLADYSQPNSLLPLLTNIGIILSPNTFKGMRKFQYQCLKAQFPKIDNTLKILMKEIIKIDGKNREWAVVLKSILRLPLLKQKFMDDHTQPTMTTKQLNEYFENPLMALTPLQQCLKFRYHQPVSRRIMDGVESLNILINILTLNLFSFIKLLDYLTNKAINLCEKTIGPHGSINNLKKNNSTSNRFQLLEALCEIFHIYLDKEDAEETLYNLNAKRNRLMNKTIDVLKSIDQLNKILINDFVIHIIKNHLKNNELSLTSHHQDKKQVKKLFNWGNLRTYNFEKDWVKATYSIFQNIVLIDDETTQKKFILIFSNNNIKLYFARDPASNPILFSLRGFYCNLQSRNISHLGEFENILTYRYRNKMEIHQEIKMLKLFLPAPESMLITNDYDEQTWKTHQKTMVDIVASMEKNMEKTKKSFKKIEKSHGFLLLKLFPLMVDFPFVDLKHHWKFFGFNRGFLPGIVSYFIGRNNLLIKNNDNLKSIKTLNHVFKVELLESIPFTWDKQLFIVNNQLYLIPKGAMEKPVFVKSKKSKKKRLSNKSNKKKSLLFHREFPFKKHKKRKF